MITRGVDIRFRYGNTWSEWHRVKTASEAEALVIPEDAKVYTLDDWECIDFKVGKQVLTIKNKKGNFLFCTLFLKHLNIREIEIRYKFYDSIQIDTLYKNGIVELPFSWDFESKKPIDDNIIAYDVGFEYDILKLFIGKLCCDGCTITKSKLNGSDVICGGFITIDPKVIFKNSDKVYFKGKDSYHYLTKNDNKCKELVVKYEQDVNIDYKLFTLEDYEFNILGNTHYLPDECIKLLKILKKYKYPMEKGKFIQLDDLDLMVLNIGEFYLTFKRGIDVSS